jgi:protein phosphatase
VTPRTEWILQARRRGDYGVSHSDAVSLIPAAFGISDRGRVRQNNEDQFLIAELTKSMRVRQTTLHEPRLQVGDQRAHLFLVADGMGGEHAGERASALAVTAIEQFTLNNFTWFLGRGHADTAHALAAFQTAMTQADARVFDEAAAHPELEGMGTTLTLAFHLGRQLCVVHVGDTRAYVYRNAELHQLTEDHTVVAEMIRNGAVEPDAAARHPLRHVITNVIGGRDRGVRVEAHALDVQPRDYLVLCSDGLTEMVSGEAIASTLSAHEEPEAVATQLVQLANEGGGRDNVTVIVVRFDAADPAPGALHDAPAMASGTSSPKA